MSSTLNPTPAMMAAYKGSIVSTLKNDLPVDVLASTVAPILTCVNQWASQIPAMLEGPSPSPNANIIFAIRKELFQPPQYINNIFGKPLSELPAPFQEFANFIRDLQDAQKVERERPVVKVRFSVFLKARGLTCCLSQPNASLALSSPSHSSTMRKSK